ncbi:putative isoamylase [Magnetofaba australis IT-1]|uniref:Putative isoamylase n=1 Tax=Magnetofaba australis IT-1 TaxID=1434232 RepID=A0A1Y2KBV0_9PROT|nr:putative isoamylase [Magnetofaba australis IT-1]
MPPEKAVIYEAHVRGLTQHPSASNLKSILTGLPDFAAVEDVPEALRGTYAGAAYMAPYLKALGFTTIELLPIHFIANIRDPALQPRDNYWGYMSLGFFAPNRRYAHDQSPGGPTREFKAMVAAFHAQGMEVYLDVVYNHTGEGGNWYGRQDTTAFVSFGGFDAPEYYVLSHENHLLDGATGCGNQISFSSPVCHELVMDSLHYWIHDMGVDGFRFDLALALGRLPNHFQKDDWANQRKFFDQHPLLLRIAELGKREEVEMIAEAWDLWGYEVGAFPAHWGEWNGRFRDALRMFVRGDGSAVETVRMLNGDYENFSDKGGPQHSINFLVAHDGFTLADLVSYDHKTNAVLEWPFGPSDGGSDDNLSSGWGGDHALRRQQMRNFWTLLMFSRGAPMAVAGDEFGRTQNGNNNTWDVDSPATWNNYAMIASHCPQAVPSGCEAPYHNNLGCAEAAPEAVNPLFVFVHYLLNLHRVSPALQQRQYADMEMDSGADVTYQFLPEHGQGHIEPHHRCIRLQINGRAVGETDYLLCINMGEQAADFAVPLAQPGLRWVRIIDTDRWAEARGNCWPQGERDEVMHSYGVNPRAIAVLHEVPQKSPG